MISSELFALKACLKKKKKEGGDKALPSFCIC